MTENEELLKNISEQMSKSLLEDAELHNIIGTNLALYTHLVEIYAQAICATFSVPVDLVTIYECQSHMNEHISDILNTPTDTVNFIMAIIIAAALALIDSEGGPNV